MAANGTDALELLRQQPVDLLLLDYRMPGLSGEEVVTQLRQFNSHVQVILQMGYASEQLPREMLRRLDIQGYHDKSEGPEKLLLWADVGLKAAYTVQLLSKSRQGLRYILAVTPDLHRLQPLEDLLQGILLQIAGLLGAANPFLALRSPDGAWTRPAGTVEMEGFLAMLEDDSELVIRAGTGRFQPRSVDVIYLDRPAIHERDLELLHLLANQVAVAIQNAQLYQMATIDPLTQVYVRAFFEQCL